MVVTLAVFDETYWVIRNKVDKEVPTFRVPVDGGRLQIDHHSGWRDWQFGEDYVNVELGDVVALFNSIDIEIHLEKMWT